MSIINSQIQLNYQCTSKTQTRTDLRPESNTQKAVITYIYILNLG
jgi:hypothetical protein